jgi:hypothetical protein
MTSRDGQQPIVSSSQYHYHHHTISIIIIIIPQQAKYAEASEDRKSWVPEDSTPTTRKTTELEHILSLSGEELIHVDYSHRLFSHHRLG